MGKSKPRNRPKNRDNPTAKPIKPPSDPELAAIREQRILPILRDLQSVSTETRSAAGKAITNLIEDPKCRKLLLREQIVRILFEQTLTDSNLEARTTGWGILRNLVLEEEKDFCVHLYRQDIKTAIEGVAKSINETIQPNHASLSKLPKAQQNLVWNLSSSIINILSSLSEAQEEIAEAISSSSSIIEFLFNLISFETTPHEVQNETLSCLTTLTEDNKILGEKIVANEEWLSRLLIIKDGEVLNSITACGLLHNIFSSMKWFDHNTPKEGLSDALLIPLLVDSIEKSNSLKNGSNGNTVNINPDQILQLALEITATIATSLQEALEHGSKHEKVFEGFDDTDPAHDGDKMEEDGEDLPGDEDIDEEYDEMSQAEIDADMEMVTGDGSDEDEPAIEEVTLDRLVRLAAPAILLVARSSLDEVEQNSTLPGAALSALNNIAWTVSCIDFSTAHLESLHKFWSALVKSIWGEIISPVLASNTADIDLASSITSLAWAISRSVQGAVEIRPEEQRKFMALYHASKNLSLPSSNESQDPQGDETDAFQSLGVKSIGVLGRLALDPAPIPLNREIGVFLLTILATIPETPAADIVEALNQIFEIYADKAFAYDEAVFWADGFYQHLEEILPKARKMAKGIDKRKFAELRDRADEAVSNLGRFLRYKKSERNQQQ